MEHKSGFTLVELLVATSIMLIVGALAVACLFSVTHVWERCASTSTSGAFEFTECFQNDVAKAIVAKGVDGDAGTCEFWMDALAPCKVCYRRLEKSQSVLRSVQSETASDQPVVHSDANESGQMFYFPGKFEFSYGFFDDSMEVIWCDSASSDSIPPDYIRIAADGFPTRIIGFRRGAK